MVVNNKRAQNDVAILITLIGLLICGFLITFLLITSYVAKPTYQSTAADYEVQQGLYVRDSTQDPYLDENTYVLNYIANREAKYSRSSKSSEDDADLSRGLILYLPFDEPTDAEVFVDKSGNGRNARCSSSPMSCPISQTDGHKGTAVTFDGQDDLLLVPYSPDFTPSNAYTISFWFKGTKQQAGQVFLATWDGSTNNIGTQVDLAIAGVCEGLDFYVSEDGTAGNDEHRVYRRDCTGGLRMDGGWHNVVAVFEPNQRIDLFVDGVLVGQTVGNVDSIDRVFDAHLPLRIGSGFFGVTNSNPKEGPFQGSMDEVRFYNRALSAKEISALYSN